MSKGIGPNADMTDGNYQFEKTSLQDCEIEDADIIADLSGGRLALQALQKRVVDLKAENARLKEQCAEAHNHVACLWCSTKIPVDCSCKEGKVKFMGDMAEHLLDCEKHPLAMRIVVLAAENAKLKAENARLHNENLRLREEIANQHGEIAEMRSMMLD